MRVFHDRNRSMHLETTNVSVLKHSIENLRKRVAKLEGSLAQDPTPVEGYHMAFKAGSNSIPVVYGRNGVMEIGRYIDFHRDGNKDYDIRLCPEDWNCNVLRIQKPGGDCGLRCGDMKLMGPTNNGVQSKFWIRAGWSSDGKRRFWIKDGFSADGSFIYWEPERGGAGKISINNHTIIHNAPLHEDIANYTIGSPVFTSGEVFHLDGEKYVKGAGSSTDCITSVKTTGTYKEFLGICTAIHKSGETVTVGDTIKSDVVMEQDTIDFATHGDYQFRVDDSSKYSVGDTVLFDGTILDDEAPLTGKHSKSIVGRVVGIVDKNMLAIFRD